jgi:hypothetical protein
MTEDIVPVFLDPELKATTEEMRELTFKAFRKDFERLREGFWATERFVLKSHTVRHSCACGCDCCDDSYDEEVPDAWIDWLRWRQEENPYLLISGHATLEEIKNIMQNNDLLGEIRRLF